MNVISGSSCCNTAPISFSILFNSGGESPMSSLRRKIIPAITVVLVAVVALALYGCGGSNNAAGTSTSEIKLQGAGATFPNPIYQKWFSEYNKITPNAKFDYQSIGSGGGIKQISAKTVDFGGSAAPMKHDELKAAPGEILHIPTVLVAVVVTYNLPNVQTDLKLTPQVIAAIFLAKIPSVNDPVLA